MKRVYQCEICLQTHPTPRLAHACERRGIFNTKKFAEPGFMFPLFQNNIYVGIAGIAPDSVRLHEHDKHTGYIIYNVSNGNLQPSFTMMAFDDEVFVYTDESIRKFIRSRRTNRIYIKEPEFIHMADKFKELGITPFYYADNGKKIYF
jgi:hypothetical protein